MRVVLSMLALLLVCAPVVLAGSPHFVSCRLASQDGQICVEGKEAGLGDEAQITVELEVMAHCQNPGNQDPEAANKETFTTDATVPVQNGKALYEICVTPTFSPSCDPPMTTIVDSIVVVDASNGLSCVLH